MIKAAALVFCFSVSPCVAMTGAEFLQADKRFAVGYAFGVVDERITIVWKDDVWLKQVHDCVINSKMDAETIYYVSFRYFQRNPSSLAEKALFGILNAINEVCIPKAQD